MTTSQRVDNVIMVYSYNVILYINENEGITVTCVDMDESHHCNIEWKKQDTEDWLHIPWFYLYVSNASIKSVVKSQESSNEWIKKWGT